MTFDGSRSGSFDEFPLVEPGKPLLLHVQQDTPVLEGLHQVCLHLLAKACQDLQEREKTSDAAYKAAYTTYTWVQKAVHTGYTIVDDSHHLICLPPPEGEEVKVPFQLYCFTKGLLRRSDRGLLTTLSEHMTPAQFSDLQNKKIASVICSKSNHASHSYLIRIIPGHAVKVDAMLQRLLGDLGEYLLTQYWTIPLPSAEETSDSLDNSRGTQTETNYFILTEPTSATASSTNLAATSVDKTSAAGGAFPPPSPSPVSVVADCLVLLSINEKESLKAAVDDQVDWPQTHALGGDADNVPESKHETEEAAAAEAAGGLEGQKRDEEVSKALFHKRMNHFKALLHALSKEADSPQRRSRLSQEHLETISSFALQLLADQLDPLTQGWSEGTTADQKQMFVRLLKIFLEEDVISRCGAAAELKKKVNTAFRSSRRSRTGSIESDLDDPLNGKVLIALIEDLNKY